MGMCCSSKIKVERKTQYGLNKEIFGPKSATDQTEKKNAPLQLQVEAQTKEQLAASTDNINYFYKMLNIIGHGSFGTVRIAVEREDIHQTGRKYAIKTLDMNNPKSKPLQLKRELEILKKLDHPNIITFYEIFQDQMYLHYVMEYCDGGDLLAFVMERSFLYEEIAARIMYKLFSAVNHMHENDIWHRDIKMENILFSSKKNCYKDSEVKIIDFGLSRYFGDQKDEDKQRLSYVGTPLYVSPEVVMNSPYNDKADCWSLGVIMYVLLSGKQPFFAQDVDECYDKILNCDFDFPDEDWKEKSESCKELIKNLLKFDQASRFSCEQALKHAWFEEYYLKENQLKYDKKLTTIKPTLENLMTFTCDNHLKKEALKVLINHELNIQQLDELRTEFKALDYDKNGVISFDDMLHAFKRQGIKISEMQLFEVFNTIHKTFSNQDLLKNTKLLIESNSDSIQLQKEKLETRKKIQINYSEFLASALNLKVYLNKEKLWSLFTHFDVDKQGYLTINSIKELVAREGRSLPEDEVQALVKEVGDKLDFNHFCKLLNPEIDIDLDKQKLVSTKEAKRTPVLVNKFNFQ